MTIYLYISFSYIIGRRLFFYRRLPFFTQLCPFGLFFLWRSLSLFRFLRLFLHLIVLLFLLKGCSPFWGHKISVFPVVDIELDDDQ